MKAELTQVWRTFWDERSPRERQLLAWGGGVAAFALAYSILWAPAQEGSTRIAHELPGMRETLARMTAQAGEARTLSAAAQGAAPTGGALRDALAASLNAHGMDGSQLQIVGSGVQLQLKNVAFPAWVAWLDEARTQFKVQVGSAQVAGLPAPGQVDVTAVMQPAQIQ